MINKKTGENAINVVPGAAGKITKNDIDKASQTIKESEIFLTQLEAPLDAVEYAIEIASSNISVKMFIESLASGPLRVAFVSTALFGPTS